MSEFPSWSLIESDPGVFSELVSKMGVKGVQVEEIWSMDAFSIKQLSPVYGLIFLFKWESTRQVPSGELYNPTPESGVYFPRQIVPNACATQAILSVLMNSADIELGDELQSFKSFTEDFPSDLKGEMIGNSDLLRSAHNSFSNPNDFISERLSERIKGGESEDLFHFVAFMPINGHLYELDGLKSSPRKMEPCTDEDWIDRALDGIQIKINSYGGGELRFSLMAVCADRVIALQAQVDQIKEGLMEFYDPTTKSNVSRQDLSAMDIRLDALQEEILNEEAKQNKWKKENSLRRHNFIPLFIQLLAEASRSGRLGPMIKDACSKK